MALYDGPNYTGLRENFTGDENDLRDNPILQRASSLRINRDCGRQAVLFTDINYLAPLGWKNRASSIALTPWVDLIVADDGILGVTLTWRFTGNQPDLRLTCIGNDRIGRVQTD